MLSTFVVTDLLDFIDADILLSSFVHHSIWWMEITRKETSSFSLWWKKTNLTTSKSLPNISLTWINFMHVKLQLVLVWSSMMAFSLYHLFSWDCLCKQFFSYNWSQSSSNFNTFFFITSKHLKFFNTNINRESFGKAPKIIFRKYCLPCLLSVKKGHLKVFNFSRRDFFIELSFLRKK